MTVGEFARAHLDKRRSQKSFRLILSHVLLRSRAVV
jgi:hypothetical protein